MRIAFVIGLLLIAGCAGSPSDIRVPDQQRPAPGLGDLCSDDCEEFCARNGPACDAYCRDNPENPACRGGEGKERGTPAPGMHIQPGRTYETTVHRTEPLVLGAGDVLEIRDTHYIIENDVRLSGDARLVIVDSLIEHRSDYTDQYSLEAKDSSSVVISRSYIATSNITGTGWNFFDTSSLIANDRDQPGFGVWHLFTDASSAEVTDAYRFGFTTCSEASATVRDSEDILVELCTHNGSVMDESLPRRVDDFSFPNADERHVDTNVRITNSTVEKWGVTLAPGASTTVRDGHRIHISVIVGSPWVGETVRLEGLRAGYHEDRTWEALDARIRLINSTVHAWEPNAWGNTLIVTDSDLSSSTLGAHATEVFENCTFSDDVRAGQGMRITLRGCLLQDVIAVADGTVTVIDSELRTRPGGGSGNVFASGEGVVELINSTYAGSLVEQGNGRIVVS